MDRSAKIGGRVAGRLFGRQVHLYRVRNYRVAAGSKVKPGTDAVRRYQSPVLRDLTYHGPAP
jgi:hypothetical protein